MVQIRLFRMLVSMEFLFIMFLFAGVFKESLSFPVDLAAFFLAALLLKIALRAMKNFEIKKAWKTHAVFAFSLILITMISLLFNGISELAGGKLMRLILLTLPAFLLPLLIVKNQESLKRFILSLAMLSAILSLFSIPLILNADGLFVGFNDGNYQGLARVTGVGLIALAYYFVVGNKKQKLVALPFLLLVSFTLFSTGSRMPIIAIAFLAMYALLHFVKVEKKDFLIKKKAVSALLIVGALALSLPYFYSKGYFQTIIYRFEVLFTDTGGTSTQGRIERIDVAFRMFMENVFVGGGFGNFGKYYHLTEGVYAHNMFLEFMSEMGLIGILWISAFLSVIVYRGFIFYKTKNGSLDAVQVTMILVFLYFFINSMVSGDINSNRSVFAFGSILMISPFLRFTKKRALKEEVQT